MQYFCVWLCFSNASSKEGLYFIVYTSVTSSKMFFELTNKTITIMHDFILKFHSTKFYFDSLVISEIK
jgi:hypothetical protein